MKLLDTIRSLIDTPQKQRTAAPIHVPFSDLLPDLGHARIYTDSDRALSAITPSAGGLTVQDDVRDVEEAFRSSVAIKGGARIAMVEGNQNRPSITSGGTASWEPETGTPNEATVTFGNLSLEPRRCVAWFNVSNQLLRQSPALAEIALKRDLFAAVAAALDVAVFSGVGTNEPLGLLFNDAVPHTLTFGGAAELADFCAMEKTLGDANAEQIQPVFVSTPATRSKLRQKEAFTGAGAIWTNQNEILGHPAYASTALAGDVAVYGNFADMLICIWGGGMQLIVDPYTNKKSHQTELQVTLLADCGPLRPSSFCRSTDSAAQ